MKKALALLVLFTLGFVFAQVTQVPGYPAFSEAPAQFELLEERDDTLLVRHAAGETEIPAEPQRIYFNTNIEVPVALGLPVVGGWHGSWEPMPPSLADATKDVEIVDWAAVPNYEFIL